jgi:hypothetical protein
MATMTAARRYSPKISVLMSAASPSAGELSGKRIVR